MKFTDRFITVPIKVYDAQREEALSLIDQELQKDDYLDSFFRVDKTEISHYKPTDDIDNGEFGEFKHTHVRMKNGDSFFVYLTITEFEKLLNQ